MEDGVLTRRYRSAVLGSMSTMSRAEARRELSKRVLEAEEKLKSLPAIGGSFKSYASRWLERNRERYKAGSFKQLESIVNKWLAPVVEGIGGIAVERLVSHDIDRILERLKTSNASPNTRRNVILALRSILADTKIADVIKRVRLPAPKRVRKCEALTAEQMRAAIEKAPTELSAIAMRLAAETGMRAAEIIGICGQDLSRGVNGMPVLKVRGAKTEASERILGLSSALTQDLEELAAYNGGGLACRLFNISYHRLHREVQSALTTIGASGPGTGLHSFRRGNATLMDSIGAPLRVRMDRLGHVKPETTLGIYTRSVPEDERRVAEELSRRLSC